jgi:hypothetical protein
MELLDEKDKEIMKLQKRVIDLLDKKKYPPCFILLGKTGVLTT